MYNCFSAKFRIIGILTVVTFDCGQNFQDDKFCYQLGLTVDQQHYKLTMEQPSKNDWRLTRDEYFFLFRPYELQFKSAILREHAANQRRSFRPFDNGGKQAV